jgi:flagella basal body P-ring formation protein FlgA
MILILATGAFCTAAAMSQTADKLLITLDRDAVVESPGVSLGQIAAMSGPKELVDKAVNVSLGMFCTKGQVLYIDHNTVLSRLASTGIPAWQVELTGSQTAQIHRNEKSVKPGQIVEIAKAFLEKQLTGQKISSIQPVGVMSAVVLNDPNISPEFSAVLSHYQAPGTRKITVSVSQGGIPIAQREAVFAVQYQVRRVVALRELLPGTVITASDVKIERVDASTPEPDNWKEPFGLAVRRKISENSQVHPEWVGPAQARVIIRRNQQVMVLLDTGAMSLSAPGQAMDEGRSGELIRIKRGQRPDERIIYCTVQADGTVRPQI